MVEHTPGPWRTSPWSEKEATIVASVKGAPQHVCGPSLNVDARLIAAAPTLLDVAVQLEESLTADGYASPLVDDLRAAISLAKGESS